MELLLQAKSSAWLEQKGGHRLGPKKAVWPRSDLIRSDRMEQTLGCRWINMDLCLELQCGSVISARR